MRFARSQPNPRTNKQSVADIGSASCHRAAYEHEDQHLGETGPRGPRGFFVGSSIMKFPLASTGLEVKGEIQGCGSMPCASAGLF